MATRLPQVLATTRFVVENARYVEVDSERVQSVADQLARREPRPGTFDCVRHVCGDEPWVANFVLILDTLNFSFWPDPGQPKWRVTYRGETVDGYWALVASLRRALDEGVPIVEADYLASLAEPALGRVLRGEGDVQIPLLAERAVALRDVGRRLRDGYAGQAVNLIRAAGQDALRLTALVAREFPSFDDVADYGGHRIEFYKRAQIFCGDLVGAGQGAEWARLSSLDRLTAFADYKVPQVLRQLGILVYSDALAEAIEQRALLPPGSIYEVEIRSATIWGVEFLRRALAGRGIDLPAYQLDWHLWDLGQALPAGTEPYHLTRTIFY